MAAGLLCAAGLVLFTSAAAWSTLRGGRGSASLWLRGLIVVLLVLSLAGLSLIRPTRELFVVFAVDRSESVGEKGIEARQIRF